VQCHVTVAAAATLGKPDASVMKLSHPTHIRLTQDLLQRLDSWRGDRMNRATAIRLLLEQALEQARR
jgi:hypothetical protein